MKIVAFILARMDSDRLPGKVLLDVHGKPILQYLYDRITSASLVDDIVITTSTNNKDNCIEKFCSINNISLFRGAEFDVLDRLSCAVSEYCADIGVVIYGDCPLLCPQIVDNMIENFLKNDGEYDFVCNSLETTYPPGMEVEVFSKDSIQLADKLADTEEVREHATLFIRQNHDLFNIMNITAPKKFNYPDMEIELDTKEDFEVISEVLKHFKYTTNFSLTDIIEFLNKNNNIIKINRNIHRRWKKYRH